MTTTSTPQRQLNPPGSVRAAVGGIGVVVVIGLLSATIIFAGSWPGLSEAVLIVVGQSITVVIPGVLALSIYRGASSARWLYLGLISIGIALRAMGLVDSVSSAARVNATLQAVSIAASLCTIVLLSTAPARRYFTVSRRYAETRHVST